MRKGMYGHRLARVERGTPLAWTKTDCNERHRRRSKGAGGAVVPPNETLRGFSPQVSVRRSCFKTDTDGGRLGQQLHLVHAAVKLRSPKSVRLQM